MAETDDHTIQAPAHRRSQAQERPAALTPMFPAGSPIRTVAAEALTLLAGGRAILLQLAHPSVAAGVAQHGSFQEDPLGRLLGTLRFINTVVFGTRAEAEAAAKRLHESHRTITGRTRADTEQVPAGTPYGGNEPELVLWVFATLIDSSLVGYQCFVRPLSEQQQQRYYQQATEIARLLALPDSMLPRTLAAYRKYWDNMLKEGPIEVTAPARRLAQHVLHPQVSGPAGLSAWLLRLATAATLSPHLRSEYGLPWNRFRRYQFEVLSRTTRTLRPLVPRWVWQNPLLGPGLPRVLLAGLNVDENTAQGAGERGDDKEH